MSGENRRNTAKLVFLVSLIVILFMIILFSDDFYSTIGAFIAFIFIVLLALIWFSGPKKSKDGIPLRLLRESEVQITDEKQVSENENNIPKFIIYSLLAIISISYRIITYDGDIITIARSLILDMIVISLFACIFESRRDRGNDKVSLNPIVHV